MNIIVALLILGLIIIIHELGHFLLAKKNGITVTEFSIGMGPRIASFVKNGTRYSLKVFPIGGSCMMLGEDETVEDAGAFHKKSVWARFSVIFAGAFFNFVLAFIIALIVLGSDGVDIPKVLEVEEGSAAAKAGIMPGDIITEIDGKKVNLGREVLFNFYFNPISDNPVEVTYLRDKTENTVMLNPVQTYRYQLGFEYIPGGDPAIIQNIVVDGPMEQTGLMIGDTITSIDGILIASGTELADYMDQNPLTDKSITLTYERNGEELGPVTITPRLVSNEYELGWRYNLWAERISPVNVFKYSIYELKYNVVTTIKSVGYLISGRIGMNEIAGPVGMVNYVDTIVDETKDYGFKVTLLELARFMILISANLGVMNLLPLPALDGGRLVFLIIEAVRGKPVPKEKEAMVHFVGLALLMVLMVFVLFNDLRNIFG
ncbi:RIP metalloprotease RseP [Mobilitalea sibirica]|uniref:Zinc metalloprotease n=1 Tax=Mobilitalea sibirica TaxID=1462919 RepID=A0A8J7H607_9FIRM|nr:RIP metalloprotease RseP [Mobilitalea sibirica]MBH1942029.1 RIP metalloprotease RseP [Mobilitalea sibirica]